ncbi:MAG: ribonuclease HII [Fimbriimonadales bacterium]
MLIAGVDEAGRGCLAGPVVAGCVVLEEECHLPGLADSKQLTPAQREALFETIQQVAVAWSVGIATPREIERWNILQASLLAMARAVANLPLVPHRLLVDGKFTLPHCPIPQQAIVDGDALHPAISAGSIVAKVVRDRIMEELDRLYPGYGFVQHKGYGTPLHRERLRLLGACPAHRRTFAPVAQLCLPQLEVGLR